MFDVLSTRIVFRNRWLQMREDAIRFPDGTEGVYAYVERHRFAVVAAMDGDAIWMVEQWRHPMRARSLELPMGMAPSAQTPIEEAAALELREETGVSAERLVYVGEIAPAPALLAQTGGLFLATGLVEGAQDLERTEQDLVARRMPLGDVLAMAGDGRIADGITLAALGMLKLRGLI